ncbi:hypothetical protein ACFYYP_32420 [Microbispora rosea]
MPLPDTKTLTADDDTWTIPLYVQKAGAKGNVKCRIKVDGLGQ